MAGDSGQDAYAYLLALADRQGYVTIDNIISAADRWQLPINEVDWLSNSITTRGIIVYDEAPEKKNRIQEGDDYSDYAQSDYDAIFNRVIEMEPSLRPFIEDIKRVKPPQFREFSGVIYQAKEGNQYARNRIIEMHLRLAVRIGLQKAEQYDANLIDCIGYACVGLIIAVDKYDPDTSGAFGSFASLWIMQHILRGQKTQRPDVHYSIQKMEPYFTMYPILRERGCTTCDEVWRCDKVRGIIHEKFNCSNKQAEDILLQNLPFDSLEALMEDVFLEEDDIFGKPEDRFRRRILETLTYQDDLYEISERNEIKHIIDEVLKTLTVREQKVIRDRFGFDNGVERTLEEIARDLNVTRERVRQIENKALRKLSHSSRLQKLDSLL